MRYMTVLFLFFCVSLQVLADNNKFPITVKGGSETSFLPKWNAKIKPQKDGKDHDVVIVGGGLAGLTAALYLSDNGKRVLILEKEPELGGLAIGGIGANGVPYNRGAAYWTPPYDEELKLLEHMGVGNYLDVNKIHEPIDSYLWKEKYYDGLWEKEETMKALPASFNLFRNELKIADKEKLIPNQPIEEDSHLDLDKLSATEWIRKMPEAASKRTDDESEKIYKAFKEDSRLSKEDPMIDVIHLMEIYCRSALGTTPEYLSAIAFANFYISEIDTRYSSPFGTGQVARNMQRLLSERKHLVDVSLDSAVARISDKPDQVLVTYFKKGKWLQTKANYLVFAAQLWLAPKLIEDLDKKDPEKVETINRMDYGHYLIHVVNVKGHPYRAAYDTWTRPSDYDPRDFTDVILGRWLDPAIRGYEGMRDFKTNPQDDQGIFTIYHPFHMASQLKSRTTKEGSVKHAEMAAKYAVKRFLDGYTPFLKDNWKTSVEVKSVETNYWPYSIHIAGPGHFSKNAKILRRPVGRVMFANNNIGTPAFEEALFRGHCAANNILKRANAEFKQEEWTRCPLE